MVLIYEDLLNQCIPTWWCLWFEHLEFRGIIPKDSGSYVSSSLVLIYALDLDVTQIILWLFFLIFFIVYDIGIHFFNIFIFGFTLSHIDYSLMIFKVCYWGLFYLHGNEKILCQINLDMLRIYLNVFLLESKHISHIKNFKIIFKNIR